MYSQLVMFTRKEESFSFQFCVIELVFHDVHIYGKRQEWYQKKTIFYYY